MKAHTANLLNAIVLIILSAWGFFASGMASFTALIPAAVGLLLLGCYSGVKAQNKVIAHIAVLLTLGILIALFMPLLSAVRGGDTWAALRPMIMIATTAIALVFFIKSFIDARKARAQ